jgi:hypothetical protein
MHSIEIFAAFPQQEHCALRQWKTDQDGIFTAGNKVSRTKGTDFHADDKDVGHF